jgi:molybdopterin-guanine dinucleotide biosynthesis protein A
MTTTEGPGGGTRASVVVLAGGRSSRLGRDKAFLPLAGRPLVVHTATNLASLSDDLVIVANDLERFEPLALPARLVPDEVAGQGSLMGIYSGLRAARHASALVVACDMPFLSLPLLRYMLSLAGDHDVVIPRLQGLVEPLHAVYGRSCLPFMGQALDQGRRQITTFFDQVRVRFVEEDEIDRFDPLHRTFLNVNTLEDWEQAQRLVLVATAANELPEM